MTTTISLPIEEYNRARLFAEEQNISLDELLVMLIGQLTLKDEDALWYKQDEGFAPYTKEELMARVEEGEAQFERGEYKTHEQLMSEIQQEFPWLK